MSFLLDTDICSAFIKGNGAVTNRFVQYGGRLHISTVTLGELLAWTLRTKTSPQRSQGLQMMLQDVAVLPLDDAVARKFGEVRAWQLDNGAASPDLDFINGVTALTHGFTLVTHNTADYADIPNLQLADWLQP